MIYKIIEFLEKCGKKIIVIYINVHKFIGRHKYLNIVLINNNSYDNNPEKYKHSNKARHIVSIQH